MRVKRTSTGRFTFQVTHDDRQYIFNGLLHFFEDQYFKRGTFTTEGEVLHHIYFSVLQHFSNRINWLAHSFASARWNVTQPEATALMWFLRSYDHVPSLLELKSGLHKQLFAA